MWIIHSNGRKQRELKNLLMGKEETDLKLNIKKTLRSWRQFIIISQIGGKRWEAVTGFLCLALKSLWMVTLRVKLETIASWQESDDKPRQCVALKKGVSQEEKQVGFEPGMSDSQVYHLTALWSDTQ